jgi:hypothetical protein
VAELQRRRQSSRKLVVDLDLKRDVDLAALARLESTPDVALDLPVGVRMLDIWRSGEHGAVLFWVDREVDLWEFGHANLHLVEGELLDGVWGVTGGGGWGIFAAADYIAKDGGGLHRHGGGSYGPVRLTVALVSPEVSSIELRSDHGASSRSPGVDGFCLFGITHSDPITYARPLGADGQPLEGELLL